jgi:hypothetical protein
MTDYWEFAIVLRNLAQTIKDPEVIETIIKIAKEYEQFADSLDEFYQYLIDKDCDESYAQSLIDQVKVGGIQFFNQIKESNC